VTKKASVNRGSSGESKGTVKGVATVTPKKVTKPATKQLAQKTLIPTAYINSNEKLYGQTAVEAAELERFANRTLVRRYEIEFTCPEFTCLCPRSGFPDFATIYIRYVPDHWCVELKSLKLYINRFRNDKIFHEDVTNRILDDLVTLLDPWDIEVVGDFNVRGNIRTVITSTHSKVAKNDKKSKS
jgi:7-cyano-7-deazaguanine reductase